MQIKSLRLERFRTFSDTTFELGSFNLLVGPNNCGKTTVLHAVRAFFQLMHGHVRFEGTPPSPVYHKRFLSAAEEIAPTPDIRELWQGQQAGHPLKISVTFRDDATFSVVLRQQFGQLHVSAEDLPKNLNASTAAKYFGTQLAYMPGLVGVLVTEPYATRARRNALAAQGRYSEIFRSSLQQLKTDNPARLKAINRHLNDLFGITVTTVAFDPESDEFVTVKYRQGSSEFDVVSSGAGLQQIIQMLTYLYLTQPKILLIDEPDAHLHSKLQSRLGELFKKVATDLGAQVFLSTHSLDLIDTFSTNDVLVVDASKKKISSIGKNADLTATLVDADIIDVSSLSRLLSSKRIVVIEDDDQTILKAIDKAVGSPLFSSQSSAYVLPAKGVGNFRAIADLGKILIGLTGTAFDLTFVQDRDGMPDFIVDPFLKSQQSDGIKPHLLERHEIENYLLEPQLFVRAAKLVGRSIKVAEAERYILEAASTLKANARRASLKTAQGINRHLGTKERWTEQDLDLEVFKWFDGLDSTSLGVVQRVWPGKELLQETLKLLNADSKKKAISRGHLVASIEQGLISQDIHKLLVATANAT